MVHFREMKIHAIYVIIGSIKRFSYLKILSSFVIKLLNNE